MSRELDTEVAERVMGWVWKRGAHWDITSVPDDKQLHLLEPDDAIANQTPGEFTSVGDWPPRDGRIIWSHLPAYSTDIAAAWLVVEHFRSRWDEGDLTDRFWSFKDCGISLGGWRVEIEVCPDHDGCAAIYEATAPTLAEAICRAALAAAKGERG